MTLDVFEAWREDNTDLVVPLFYGDATRSPAPSDDSLRPSIHGTGTAAGNLTSGTITPLLSHAAAGAGRVRTLLMSQPGGGKGTCEPARADTLDTVGLQTR